MHACFWLAVLQLAVLQPNSATDLCQSVVVHPVHCGKVHNILNLTEGDLTEPGSCTQSKLMA